VILNQLPGSGEKTFIISQLLSTTTYDLVVYFNSQKNFTETLTSDSMGTLEFVSPTGPNWRILLNQNEL